MFFTKELNNFYDFINKIKRTDRKLIILCNLLTNILKIII
jgi:hypothetical protein